MAIDVRSLQQEVTQLWRADEIPPQLSWLENLSPLSYRLCIVELYSAVARAIMTNDWTDVSELIEGWEATAEVESDPEMVKELREPKEYEEFRPS